MIRFDYVVTIHDKEDLIERVIFSLLACMRNDSRILAVADGCTDRTVEILQRIQYDYADVPLSILYEDDVHEIRSINAGLRAIDPVGRGYVISLQDDVMIADWNFEAKIVDLYRRYGPSLGYVSFRLGANLVASDGPLPIAEVDLVENGCEPQLPHAENVFPGQIAFRDAAIKSPVCIPYHLLRDIGLLDEDLAPYGWDDHEYSIRSLKAGYRNAVFPIRFRSDLDWGGTRRSPHPEMPAYHHRNTRLIARKHEDFFATNRLRDSGIFDIGRDADAVAVSQA